MNTRHGTSNANVITESFHRFIRAWLDGSPERIADMIDEGIVMSIPQSSNWVRGKEEFFRALQEYRLQRCITKFDESDVVVDTEGALSVVSYRFQIEYAHVDRNVSESGIDLLVFQNKGGAWKLVRRSMLCPP
jgi:hypothetical protein